MTIIGGFNIPLGPGKDGHFTAGVTFYSLDDNNDAVAFAFAVPAAGIITDIGFLVGAKGGTPPEYKASIVTISGVDGLPTTENYGGSSPYLWTPTNTGQEFKWFTLATPATASIGDLVAIKVDPNGTIPSVTNFTRIAYNNLFIDDFKILPRVHRFVTAWVTAGGYSFWGIRYNDGSVYGIPASGIIYQEINLDTTPDEVGAKFTLPITVNCTGPTVGLPAIDLNAGVTITLYDNSDTVLRSIVFADFDKLQDNYGSISGAELKWSSPIQLTKDVVYRITVKGTTATNGVFVSGAVLDSSSSRTNNIDNSYNLWEWTERTDGGAWTDYGHILPAIGIYIDGIDIPEQQVGGASQGGAYAYVG